MTKKIGIWMDKRMAKIVSIDNNGEHLKIIESNVEDFHPKGGSGTRMKGGPQDVVQDGKYLQREKQQLKAYFDDVISNIPSSDPIVIFGPAETGRKFADEVIKSHKELQKNIQGVERADSMSDNQLKSWVKEYYSR